MPRQKGHDGRASKLLEHLENARMNLGARLFDISELELRNRQARQRTRGQLDELLVPSEERLNELMTGLKHYAEEIDKAIDEIAH